MALARNLNNKTSKFSFKKIPKLNKWAILGILVFSILIITFGATFLLPKIFPPEEVKTDIKYETGDRPLTQNTNIWVTAQGGLFMREQPDSKSKAILLIPNGTKLESLENLGEWYKVIYQEKNGWVSKSYVTTQAPAEDPTKDWKTYQNKAAGYSLRYPVSWVAQDYGANPASESVSYVGFGPQLGPTLDTSTTPPVVVKVTQKSITDVEASYMNQQGVLSEPTTVSGIAGKKFTYNSASGVQMTAIVVGKGSSVFIFEESGGYSEELNGIIPTVIFTG